MKSNAVNGAIVTCVESFEERLTNPMSCAKSVIEVDIEPLGEKRWVVVNTAIGCPAQCFWRGGRPSSITDDWDELTKVMRRDDPWWDQVDVNHTMKVSVVAEQHNGENLEDCVAGLFDDQPFVSIGLDSLLIRSNVNWRVTDNDGDVFALKDGDWKRA